MNRIFDDALGVTVYLGEPTAGSYILFEELAEADKLLSQGESCDRPSPGDNIIRELDALFRRAWFERVWVLQEVYMKDSIKLMCGSASASSEALSTLCFDYNRDTIVTKTNQPLVLELVQRPLVEFSTPQFSLWSLLYRSRACLATDPRDRIFALKSLIDLQQQSEMDYLIDYSGTFEEILIKTAMFLLPVLGLRILTAVRHPHERDMPSWIPDWSQNLPLHYYYFNVESHNPVSGQSAPKLKPLNDQTNKLRSLANGENNRTQLLVTGCRYAQIIRRSQVFSFLGLEDAKVQMERLYHSLGNLRKLVNLEDVKDDYSIYGQLGQEIAEAMSLLDGQDLHFYLSRYFGPHLDKDQFSSIGDAEDFLESLQQCRIVLMNNSELAIVAGGVQDGDMVCILSGTDSPCVLRPDQQGNWTLLCGDCFIFTDTFQFPELHGWFRCDDYIACNQHHLEGFPIR